VSKGIVFSQSFAFDYSAQAASNYEHHTTFGMQINYIKTCLLLFNMIF